MEADARGVGGERRREVQDLYSPVPKTAGSKQTVGFYQYRERQLAACIVGSRKTCGGK